MLQPPSDASSPYQKQVPKGGMTSHEISPSGKIPVLALPVPSFVMDKRESDSSVERRNSTDSNLSASLKSTSSRESTVSAPESTQVFAMDHQLTHANSRESLVMSKGETLCNEYDALDTAGVADFTNGRQLSNEYDALDTMGVANFTNGRQLRNEYDAADTMGVATSTNSVQRATHGEVQMFSMASERYDSEVSDSARRASDADIMIKVMSDSEWKKYHRASLT